MDKKDFPEHDEDPDNRLYLSQPVHYLFDGYQTAGSGKLSKKYPYLGIYFVRDEGKEVVEFNGVRNTKCTNKQFKISINPGPKP
jgi:hypothetical protein